MLDLEQLPESAQPVVQFLFLELRRAKAMQDEIAGCRQLQEHVIAAHQRAFGAKHYEYVDPQTTLDLLVAEIKTLRHELAAKDEA